MQNDLIMPTIPVANVPFRSPNRPAPKFFSEEKTFSTKKERGGTPRTGVYPRPPIKSCPPISRIFPRTQVNKPRRVSFQTSNDSLSPAYDEQKTGLLYFQQWFTIEKKLGAGSFGDVYQVRGKADGKRYAIKRSRERFKGEIDRKRKLDEVSKHEMLPEHENCVRFYKAWEERQRLYIQTELCEMSLANVSDAEHDIPEQLIWSYLIDLLRAVKHLHDYDLIHMDIKPENIFIAQDGACKLGDFGLMLDCTKSTDLLEAQEGDPKYLAPELMGGVFTKAADIFSLGITILELACDLDLPRGDDGWHQLRSGTLPQDIVRRKMSDELLHVISLMMAPDHRQRPSANALLAMPVVCRNSGYISLRRSLTRKTTRMLQPLAGVWYYFVQMCLLIWSAIGGWIFSREPSSCEDYSSSSSCPAVETSISEDDVFADETAIIAASSIDLSSDSNDSLDMSLSAGSVHKALTTGAKKTYFRSALILGIQESPSKTPSQGSPHLLPSSRSSLGSQPTQKGPSSTTPPSCRKLFDDDDNSQTHIGPKNLMSAFDHADSDED